MARIALAFKLLFKTLFDEEFARKAAGLVVETPVTAGAVSVSKPIAPPANVESGRSDALTLLAVLQREARLVDFLKEDIAGYENAQIGAAVRDVHRDAAAALERVFGLKPVVDQAEGSEVNLGGKVDANRYRLIGNVGAGAPARARLQHGGWQATRTELPKFTGSLEAANVISPAELEV